MKKIKINKKIDFFDGFIIVKYSGISDNDNFDIEKLENLLTNFITNHKKSELISVITGIRTILNNFDEKALSISYDFDNKKEFIIYINSSLSLYEKIIKNNNKNVYSFTYDSLNGIKLDYNTRNAIDEYSKLKSIKNEISKDIENTYSFMDAEAIYLDEDDKTIIEIYKLFYEENPDFSDKDIEMKIQSMLSILSGFGISLNFDYSFNLDDDKVPMSLVLKQKINRLCSYGKIDEVKDNVTLNKEAQKTIKSVGETIRNIAYCKQDLNDILIAISKMLYEMRYYTHKDNIPKEISKIVNRARIKELY